MHKKTPKALALSSAMVVLSALPAQHARAATGNIDVDAIVVTSALLVLQNQALNFGTFTDTGGGGTVAVDVAGLPTYGGVNAIASSTPTEGIIQIKGNAGKNVIISVTNPTFTVSNGTSTMKVTKFDINTNGAGSTNTLNMTAASILVPVGATLTVGAIQPIGTYTGSFTVQVIYQ
jgi:hypothetical protein